MPKGLKGFQKGSKKNVGNKYALGSKHTAETRKKMSIASKGRKQTFKKGFTPWNKGKKCPQLAGEKSHFWKGGITSKNRAIRTSLEYRNWRRMVLYRDNYACQICEKVGGLLEVHHIIPFAHNKKLRFNLDNGITMCRDCHKKTSSYAKI